MNDNDDPNRTDAPLERQAASHDAPDASMSAADLTDADITVADLIETSARTFGAHIGPILGIAFLALAPAAVASIGLQELVSSNAWTTSSRHIGSDGLWWVAILATLGAGLLQTVLQFFAQAAVAYATVDLVAGRRASVGRALRAAFTHAWSILALALLHSLAIGFGLLACIIPGIVLMCVLFAAVPSAVVDRLGPLAAMQRSAELTSGHRVTIFLAFVVVTFVYSVIAIPVMLGVGALGGVALDPSWILFRFMLHGIQWLGTILYTSFYAVLAAVFYARARGFHDRVDADRIAQVFA